MPAEALTKLVPGLFLPPILLPNSLLMKTNLMGLVLSLSIGDPILPSFLIKSLTGAFLL